MLQKLDGWFNLLTGLNIRGRDASASTSINYRVLTQQEAEDLYAGDDVAEKIVDYLVEESLRQGYEIKGLDQEILDKTMESLRKLNFDYHLEEADKKARLYGGGFIFLNTGDGSDTAKPIHTSDYKKIKSLVTFDRYELWPIYESIESDINSSNFGMPTIYTLQPTGREGVKSTNLFQRIHHTRLIRIDGRKLPRNAFLRNNYYHDSVLSKLRDLLANFGQANQALSTTLSDFKISLLKMKNLADIVAQNGVTEVQNRIEIMKLSKSTVNMMLIDENEDFQQLTTSLSGVKDVADFVANRMVAGSNLPHTVLLGESPSGLGATGESEQSTWYDYVKTHQESKLRPAIMQFLKVLMLSKEGPTSGEYPESLTLEFYPLWQMSEKQQVEIRKIQADTDAIYMDRGVVDVGEIRDSRFGGEQYTIETTINNQQESFEETELS